MTKAWYDAASLTVILFFSFCQVKIAYINFLNHCYVDTEVEMKEIYTSNHMWKLFENFLVDICRVSHIRHERGGVLPVDGECHLYLRYATGLCDKVSCGDLTCGPHAGSAIERLRIMLTSPLSVPRCATTPVTGSM